GGTADGAAPAPKRARKRTTPAEADPATATDAAAEPGDPTITP
ncbi:alpha/beta hydrolase, partial [Clavibacter nebraskensis]